MLSISMIVSVQSLAAIPEVNQPLNSDTLSHIGDRFISSFLIGWLKVPEAPSVGLECAGRFQENPTFTIFLGDAPFKINRTNEVCNLET